MRCFCCGKELKNNDICWHKSCINKFFGSNILPEIDSLVLNDTLEKLGENKQVLRKSLK